MTSASLSARRRPVRALVAAPLALLVLTACASPAAPKLTVVAGGLANPRQLSVGPDGVVYVAEAGDGGRRRCTEDPDTGHQICVGATGSIARIVGRTRRCGWSAACRRWLAGRRSQDASGPADVVLSGP